MDRIDYRVSHNASFPEFPGTRSQWLVLPTVPTTTTVIDQASQCGCNNILTIDLIIINYKLLLSQWSWLSIFANTCPQLRGGNDANMHHLVATAHWSNKFLSSCMYFINLQWCQVCFVFTYPLSRQL